MALTAAFDGRDLTQKNKELAVEMLRQACINKQDVKGGAVFTKYAIGSQDCDINGEYVHSSAQQLEYNFI